MLNNKYETGLDFVQAFFLFAKDDDWAVEDMSLEPVSLVSSTNVSRVMKTTVEAHDRSFSHKSNIEQRNAQQQQQSAVQSRRKPGKRPGRVNISSDE